MLMGILWSRGLRFRAWLCPGLGVCSVVLPRAQGLKCASAQCSRLRALLVLKVEGFARGSVQETTSVYVDSGSENKNVKRVLRRGSLSPMGGQSWEHAQEHFGFSLEVLYNYDVHQCILVTARAGLGV